MKINFIGNKIYNDIKELFPLNRSLSGEDNRKTLRYFKKKISNLKILEFKSGTRAFDWTVPPEWNVVDAWVKCGGKKIIDFKKNNLHLVSYSTSVNKTIELKELEKHLHYLPKKPNCIPYITSYYKKNWGFCIKHNLKKKLSKKKKYKVFIDSKFKKNGSMSIGELIIKGKSKKEILLSTNICHPSMVNNELCAPVILSYLAKYFKSKKNFYTLRILFLPETIGSITYLKKNYKKLKKNFFAGFHICCFGDKGNFSMISTKYENSYSDEISKLVLNSKKKYNIYPFKYCGSDERQYNFPGINLPVVTLTRSKFGEYKEYHNSMDNLKITNGKLLQESYELLINLINIINKDKAIEYTKKNKIKNDIIKPKDKKFRKKPYNDFKVYSLTKCEPFLSKRNLYRNVSKNFLTKNEFIMFNLLYYGDGFRIDEISKVISVSSQKIIKIAKLLEKNKLIKLSRN